MLLSEWIGCNRPRIRSFMYFVILVITGVLKVQLLAQNIGIKELIRKLPLQ